ncbi:MAG: TatD family hydrolase [Rhodocyclaceae bacterium]
MLIDTHIHLDAPDFDANREQVLAEARAVGVQRFVVPGVTRTNFADVRALAETHADVRFALGIHPLYVDRADEGDLGALEDALGQGGAVAVGEIGLDHFVADRDEARQSLFYEAQLRLARRFALPVILHVRRAVDPVLKQLRRIEVRGGIAHAFNGSRQQADAFIAMGFKLGFGGAMTYDGSRRIRALAAELPLDSIVLETDAPDIPPSWAADGRTQPSDLWRFAETLAGLRGIPVEEVISATGRNALAVFGRQLS